MQYKIESICDTYLCKQYSVLAGIEYLALYCQLVLNHWLDVSGL